MPIEIRNTIENAVALRAFEKEKMFLVLSGRYLVSVSHNVFPTQSVILIDYNLLNVPIKRPFNK